MKKENFTKFITAVIGLGLIAVPLYFFATNELTLDYFKSRVTEAAHDCCYQECPVLNARRCDNNVAQVCSNCDSDYFRDWCDVQDCSLTGEGCNSGYCGTAPTCSDGTVYGSCSTASGPPTYCDNSGNLVDNCAKCGCAGSAQCYNPPGTSCFSPCVADGCNGVCPGSCTAGEDPDCPGYCLDCTCASDSDCISTCAANDGCCKGCYPEDSDCVGCVPSCASQPGCSTVTPANSQAAAGTCCNTGESCYQCATGFLWNGSACSSGGDTIAPTVDSFTIATRNSVDPIAASWSASDASNNLMQVELWVTTDNAGTPAAGSWSLVSTVQASGGSASGQFDYTPQTGTWWFGIHAVDQAGNMGPEPNPPGPIQVVKTGSCTADGCNQICPPGCSPNGDPDCNCNTGNSCCGLGCSLATGDSDCSGAMTATITDPISGYKTTENSTINFQGIASGGTPPYTYSWDSSIDGNLGTGQTITVP